MLRHSTPRIVRQSVSWSSNVLVTLTTVPVHPQATRVPLYPALFYQTITVTKSHRLWILWKYSPRLLKLFLMHANEEQ